LKALLKGKPCHAYNISNPNSIISIKEMAEIITDTAGVALKTELPTETERRGFNPMLNASLDSSDLSALGWRGQFDARRGFNHTIRILKDCMEG
jgi:nucleoside-diphosphate-sugar epimerase